MLVRYSGTKVARFEAAFIWTVERNSVFVLDKAGFGVAMATLIRERSSIDITAMLVRALANPEAQPIATRMARERMARERMTEPLAQWLGGADALDRAMNMFGLLTAFAVQDQGIVAGDASARSLDWLAQNAAGDHRRSVTVASPRGVTPTRTQAIPIRRFSPDPSAASGEAPGEVSACVRSSLR